MIEAGGDRIYIDPAKPANIEGLPPGDLILITDIHGDHMDTGDIAALSNAQTEIVAPAAVQKTVTAATVLGNGQSMTWRKWKITAVPMYNIEHNMPNGTPYHPHRKMLCGDPDLDAAKSACGCRIVSVTEEDQELLAYCRRARHYDSDLLQRQWLAVLRSDDFSGWGLSTSTRKPAPAVAGKRWRACLCSDTGAWGEAADIRDSGATVTLHDLHNITVGYYCSLAG